MAPNERDYLVYRICMGFLKFKYQDNTYLLKNPSLEQKYLAEELYQEKLEEYHLAGHFNEIEYLQFLLNKGLWDDGREVLFNKFKEKIEDLKIELFNAQYKSKTRKEIKKKINRAVEDYKSLIGQRNCEIHKSATGLAGIARLRYLIGVCLYRKNEQVFNLDDFWQLEDNGLLDTAVNYYNQSKIDESQFRELVRNEPWHSYWMCRKACGDKLFGICAIDLSDDQKSLVYWSLLYDGVYEHPDCPSQEVIEDDDMLDGFLLKDFRERKDKQNKTNIEDKLSDKLKNAHEIYLIAETPEDAKKINDLNSDWAKAVKASRDKMIDQKGIVNELEFP